MRTAKVFIAFNFVSCSHSHKNDLLKLLNSSILSPFYVSFELSFTYLYYRKLKAIVFRCMFRIGISSYSANSRIITDHWNHWMFLNCYFSEQNYTSLNGLNFNGSHPLLSFILYFSNLTTFAFLFWTTDSWHIITSGWFTFRFRITQLNASVVINKFKILRIKQWFWQMGILGNSRWTMCKVSYSFFKLIELLLKLFYRLLPN